MWLYAHYLAFFYLKVALIIVWGHGDVHCFRNGRYACTVYGKHGYHSCGNGDGPHI